MSKLTKALTAAAGNAGGDNLYVEDVFSTYLYDGNGTTQTITNGIDLSGEGGLVWCKPRTVGNPHYLGDTERGTTKFLESNSTAAEGTSTGDVTAFNADGFSVGATGRVNQAGQSFASWTFRKAEKFFDVVTYTGDGVTGRTVSHNLGSAPGFILVKCTSSAQAWAVYHKSKGASYYTDLTTAQFYLNSNRWNGIEPTETEFTCGSSTTVNQSGQTFVAYLFASDAGGFGDDGSESVIKCGLATVGADGNAYVTLGYEPQFILSKRINSTGGGWFLTDTMRGLPGGASGQADDALLYANAATAELIASIATINATGFSLDGWTNGDQFIYIAIRRPMKTPESGTEVFSANAVTVPVGTQITTGFAVDALFATYRLGQGTRVETRLAGVSTTRGSNTSKYLNAFSTEAEKAAAGYLEGWNNNGFLQSAGYANAPDVYHSFKRATGFFDVVAYTGTGVSSQTFNHNLGVVPELMIIKCRSQAAGGGWLVYSQALGNNSAIVLNDTGASFTPAAYWNTTSPTDSVFSVNADTDVGNTGRTYIAYLFATLAGVSKVGSYTGTGTHDTHVIDCGFSNGARFVLLKRTDASSDWFLWDSERGITNGADPRLSLNSTAAEYNGLDDIRPHPSGFIAANPNGSDVNASGSEWIFLAIA